MASIHHSKTLKNSELGKALVARQDSYVNGKRQMDSPTGAGLRPSASGQQLLAGGGLEPLLGEKGVDGTEHLAKQRRRRNDDTKRSHLTCNPKAPIHRSGRRGAAG